MQINQAVIEYRASYRPGPHLPSSWPQGWAIWMLPPAEAQRTDLSFRNGGPNGTERRSGSHPVQLPQARAGQENTCGQLTVFSARSQNRRRSFHYRRHAPKSGTRWNSRVPHREPPLTWNCCLEESRLQLELARASCLAPQGQRLRRRWSMRRLHCSCFRSSASTNPPITRSRSPDVVIPDPRIADPNKGQIRLFKVFQTSSTTPHRVSSSRHAHGMGLRKLHRRENNTAEPEDGFQNRGRGLTSSPQARI